MTEDINLKCFPIQLVKKLPFFFNLKSNTIKMLILNYFFVTTLKELHNVNLLHFKQTAETTNITRVP